VRFVAGLALLVLAALISIDCLNLIQSEAWTDLTRSPHLAAVHRVKDNQSHQLVQRVAPEVRAAVVPTPAPVPWVGFVLALLLEVAWSCGVLPGSRQLSRAPPALRFSSSARS
jgi:hypothetical protein